MLPVEPGETSSKSSSLHVDIKYQKRQSGDTYIILLSNSKYKRGWINVIFLQDKHNINAAFGAKNREKARGEPRLYSSF